MTGWQLTLWTGSAEAASCTVCGLSAMNRALPICLPVSCERGRQIEAAAVNRKSETEDWTERSCELNSSRLKPTTNWHYHSHTHPLR